MNINDLGGLISGKYPSVYLASTGELDLFGSTKYVIGALTMVDDAGNGFSEMMACSDNAASSMCIEFGAKYVFPFRASDVSASGDTIKIANGLGDSWNSIKIGDTVAYAANGNDGTTALGPTTWEPDTVAGSNTAYYVIAKDEAAGTIQISTSATGSAVDLAAPDDDGGNHLRKLVSPAPVANTQALCEVAYDSNATSTGTASYVAAGQLAASQNQTAHTYYGRWNYVKTGTNTIAVATLYPR
jgi:hypothetical protein